MDNSTYWAMSGSLTLLNTNHSSSNDTSGNDTDKNSTRPGGGTDIVDWKNYEGALTRLLFFSEEPYEDTRDHWLILAYSTISMLLFSFIIYKSV